jgi:metal-responsive CopG/Arc/MetJ family transcriptional regulator
MSQKSEIKVYLPLKLIGELEGRKKIGMRSRFIEQAIREKIARFTGSTLEDWTLLSLLCGARDRMRVGTMSEDMIQILIEQELKKK